MDDKDVEDHGTGFIEFSWSNNESMEKRIFGEVIFMFFWPFRMDGIQLGDGA